MRVQIVYGLSEGRNVEVKVGTKLCLSHSFGIFSHGPATRANACSPEDLAIALRSCHFHAVVSEYCYRHKTISYEKSIRALLSPASNISLMLFLVGSVTPMVVKYADTEPYLPSNRCLNTLAHRDRS